MQNNRNYISMIGRLNNGFIDNGWADGYADLPSDENNIIKQLYQKVPVGDLIDYVDEYLSGYELGNFMSEEIEEIYDEDGELRDDKYNLATFSHYTEAKNKVLSFNKKLVKN